MDERDRSEVELPLRPVAGSGSRRATGILVAIVAGAVAVALIKPWGALPRSVPEPGPSAPARATPAGPPTIAPTPDSYANLVVICGSPSGWRAATLQHWVGRANPIRTWSAIEPVPAAAAVDPAIPFAPIASDLVTAIGYCAPRQADATPSDATPRFWALDREGGTARPLEPERLEPAVPNVLGGLWRPAVGSDVRVDGRLGWAPGRYVLRLEFGTAGRWLGIEILAPPRPGMSPGDPAAERASASPGAALP